MEAYTIELESDFKEADRYAMLLTAYVEEKHSHITSDQSFHINFALRELLNNAVEHGNQFNPDKKVVCTIQCEQEGLTIIVEDDGSGFCFGDALEKTERSILETRQRGLWLLNELGFVLSVEKNRVIAYYDWEGQG